MPHRPKPHKPPGLPVKDDRPSAHKRGYGSRWQKLRALVLAQDPLCRDCLERGLVVAATEVDHVVSKAKGGGDELANLVGLCKSCHAKKGVAHDGLLGREPKESTPPP
jgi:5-methylcytosine-specific restriction protein A